MKKHWYILFVDAENCSSKNFMKVRRKLWELEETHGNAGIYCYGLEVEKDSRLKSWREVTEGLRKCKWKWLEGTPQKNKVDNTIIEDIKSLY